MTRPTTKREKPKKLNKVMVNIIQAIILGIIQGLTEFIPVSSSGHLIVASNLIGQTSNTHLLVQALDFGTVLALIIFFRHKIINLVKQVLIERDYRLARNIIVTCIPVATIGLLLSKFIESSSFFTSSLVVAITLAIVGIIMLELEKLPHMSKISSSSGLGWRRSILIGLAQCVALIPGISRSGSTIIAGRISGLSSKEAAEYSFLVSIPVMLGLIAKLLLGDTSYLVANWQMVLVGNIAAFAAGMIAIKYLLNYLGKHDLRLFGWYRIIVAILVILMITVKVLPH